MKGFTDTTKTQSGHSFNRTTAHVKPHTRAMPAKARAELPKSDFGLPGSRKYPMPDKSHAANAKARATQMVDAGKLSESSKAKIDTKANRVLGKARGGKVRDPRTPLIGC